MVPVRRIGARILRGIRSWTLELEGSPIALPVVMPIALVTSVMPVMLILALMVMSGDGPGGRAICALVAMTDDR